MIKVPRNSGWWSLLVVALIVVGTTGLAMAEEGDGDRDRMQARMVEVGESYENRLRPPQERSSWKMVRLFDEGSLQLRLSFVPSGASVEMNLSSATGEHIRAEAAEGASGGVLEIEERVEQGIYYIEVSSDEDVDYTLQID